MDRGQRRRHSSALVVSFLSNHVPWLEVKTGGLSGPGRFIFRLRWPGSSATPRDGTRSAASPKKSKIRRKITIRKRIKSTIKMKSRTSCTRPKNAGRPALPRAPAPTPALALSSRFAHFEEGLLNKKTDRLPRDFLASCLGLRGLNKSPRQGSRPMELTDSFVTLLQSFDPVFTAPTYQTFVVIITGWILSQRHRYVTEVIFSSGHVGDGHWSRFHRFFSHAAWDIDTFSMRVAKLVVTILAPGATFFWAVDDTLCRKRGLTLYGAGMHYDPLISSRAKSLVSWGHDWVVLTLIVAFPAW